MVDVEKLFSLREASRILGVSERTVLRWCKRGLIRHRHYPDTGIRRIAESDLKQFIEKSKK